LRAIISIKNLTLIAILFHLVGFVGIGVLHNNLVAATAPWHLLLMFILLLISFSYDFRNFIKWLPLVLLIGFGTEWVGVHTGWLFGAYGYGHTLGPMWQQIPFIIAGNWAIVMCGAISLAFLATENKYLVAVLAASIATAYDWVLEPAALKLGYWHWQGMTPLYNYICWWGTAFLLSILWQYFKVRPNQFAVNLFIVQVLFFALLRTMI
jgi:putative membrane protein